MPPGADEAAREALRAAARERLHGLWEQFADTFPARPFLGGEQPDALDLMACVVSQWSGARAHLARARPAFSELLVRIDRHPKVAEILARHWPG
jgi:GST-like protein